MNPMNPARTKRKESKWTGTQNQPPGFTLVEVLVSSAILALSLLLVAPMVVGRKTRIADSSARLSATLIRGNMTQPAQYSGLESAAQRSGLRRGHGLHPEPELYGHGRRQASNLLPEGPAGQRPVQQQRPGSRVRVRPEHLPFFHSRRRQRGLPLQLFANLGGQVPAPPRQLPERTHPDRGNLPNVSRGRHPQQYPSLRFSSSPLRKPNFSSLLQHVCF